MLGVWASRYSSPARDSRIDGKLMLKPRLIAVLMLNDGVLFRTRRFVPDYRYTQSFLGSDAFDEVMIIDITRGGPSRKFDEAAERYASKCFTPVTMGGHIRSIDRIRELLLIGADKVLIGAELWRRPAFGREIAEKFGSQILCAALDYNETGVLTNQGRHQVVHGLTLDPRYAAIGAATVLEGVDAGEILLTSIERDGSLDGYDLGTIERVANAVNIPVIANGGCGNGDHMADAIKAGAAAVATSNIFHITDRGMTAMKARVKERGVPVRP